MDNQMNNSNGNGSRCYQQPRSNSISGQEFHHLGGEYHHMTAHQQRLKQQANHHLNQSPYVDANQCYSQRLQNFTQYKQNLLADRSASPASLTTQRPTDFYMPKRSSSIKYSYDTRQMPPVRNNIHASLECLNTIYSDYSQSQNQKQQQQLSTTNQLRQYQQQHFQHQLSGLQTNQHYAAGYVLAAVPPDTVVNRSAEQDLAAAAMGAPPSQQYNQTMVSSAASNMTMNNSLNQSSGLHASSNYQSQNLLSRAQQTTHSPLHRSRLGQGHGAVANILNHISSSSNPMRAGHSSLSLASSTYLIEDKLQNEIKQLQSELKSEREKNEALSSQLNINSNLMAAFEQSLNTLNNRLRQLTALNEKKDKEIDELRAQLEMSNNSNLSVDKMTKAHCGTSEKSTSPICGEQHLQIKLDYDTQDSMMSPNATSPHDNATSDSPSPFHSNSKSSSSDPRLAYKSSEGDQNLLRVIEDLKRQLIEKDRLLTDTRLEALSAAHQLEQLESRLNGEHSLLVNDDDLDEGVMVANHSPSDSDAITDSAHFSDNHSHSGSKFSHLNQQQSILQRQQHKMQQPNYQNHLPYQQQQNQQSNQRGSANLEDMMLFTPTHIGQHTSNNTSSLSNNSNNSVDDTNAMINLSLNQSNNLNHKLQQQDNQSNHSSSDYHVEDKSSGDTTIQREYNSAEAIGNTADEPTSEQTFESRRADNEAMTKMLDNLLVST